MSILLVTYDLKKPGRNYQPVYDYIKTHTWCKGLESVWLIDTTKSTQTVLDDLASLMDSNDKAFVVKLSHNWTSYNYYCADWLNDSRRNW